MNNRLLAGKVAIGQPMTDRGLRGNISHGLRQSFSRKDTPGSIQDLGTLLFARALPGFFRPRHGNPFSFLVTDSVSHYCTYSIHGCQGLDGVQRQTEKATTQLPEKRRIGGQDTSSRTARTY